MERKTERRKRDEAALNLSGFLGHTFFEVVDDPESKAMNRTVSWSCTIESAMRGRRMDSRIYQKIGKGKYRIVG